MSEGLQATIAAFQAMGETGAEAFKAYLWFKGVNSALATMILLTLAFIIRGLIRRWQDYLMRERR